MGIIQITGESVRKHNRHPTRCRECPLYWDDQVPWCSFYKKRTTAEEKPEFCKVISIMIQEEV